MPGIENIEEKSHEDSESKTPREEVHENILQQQTIDTTQSQTQNLQPQIENMEVHKHPHHSMHKKKWSEYLLEFFMLFLAVFLGFVAENIREHSVEYDR